MCSEHDCKLAKLILTFSDITSRLGAVRRTGPLVQCITNAVVMNFTANALLAVGGPPAMIDIPDEAGVFAGIASALLVNLGTPRTEQREAMLEAAAAADANGTPWVLDPVAVGALPVRTKLAHELLRHNPTAVRGNPSEILALAGTGGGGRGTDAVDTADDALAPARRLANRHHCVVAISGETDVVTDGQTVIRLHNGDVMLTRITGGGCALGAIMAAFLGTDTDRANPLQAVAAASATYTIAAEVAAERAAGPGSFAMHLIDALDGLDTATIEAHLNIVE